MKYVSVQEMIQIEQAADSSGYSYSQMMEAAGKGLADQVEIYYGGEGSRIISALIGSGNNGGDALVALEYLENQGWQTCALIVKNRPEDDHLVTRYLSSGGVVKDCTSVNQAQSIFKMYIPESDVVLDAVLGTGIKLPIRGDLKELMSMAKQIWAEINHPPIVVAVDCPSGIDCDTGAADPSAIPAQLTVTMAAVKQGLLKMPAFQYCGEITVVDIGLPARLPELESISRSVLDFYQVQKMIPYRALTAHKGTFGKVLIAAGSTSYPGAALLAGRGAYQSGAGLVQLGVPESIYPGLIGALPEAIWLSLPETDGGISRESSDQLSGALERTTAFLIGPGLGGGPARKQLMEKILEINSLPPTVIDADGLRILAGLNQWWKELPGQCVLTPHPGEMAVLTGLSVEEIQQDRVGSAEQFAADWNAVVVLKGAITVIASPEGKTRIIPIATPALATAGTGDVLAGLITGLMAQGMSPFDAAAAGSWIHARAGLQAAEILGTTASVTAGDVADAAADIFALLGR
jgi:NAD(P)H-hydrate epimerase